MLDEHSEKNGDRRSATYAQLKIVEAIGDIRVLLQKSVDHGERVETRLASIDEWVNGSPGVPGAKDHVARLLQWEQTRRTITFLIIGALCTAGAMELWPEMGEAIREWLQSY